MGSFPLKRANRRPVNQSNGELGCLSDKNSTGCPPEADTVDRPIERIDVGSVDGRFWDKAAFAKCNAEPLAILASESDLATDSDLTVSSAFGGATAVG